MSKIKSKTTGDVFEAPAADFVNSTDFEVVDDSTPVTGSVSSGEPAGSATTAAGTSEQSISAPASTASASAPTTTAGSSDAGSTSPTPETLGESSQAPGAASVTGADPGNVLASAQVAASAESSLAASALTASGTSSTVAEPVSAGTEPGNAGAGSSSAGSTQSEQATLSGQPTESDAQSQVTDSAKADAATPLNTTLPPVTDSVTGSPTGGPTAGQGATPETRTHHGLLSALEQDLRSELKAVESTPEHVFHILSAVFGRHHSTIDAKAAT